MKEFDVIIVGAGAAGLMCAREAALRGRRVAVIEHTEKTGEKIRISGGGRCNFTNLYAGPETMLSQNPHFAKSALSRYTPQDFLALVTAHGIAWHEKPYEEGAHRSAQGQLFCDGKSQQIIHMLQGDCTKAGTHIHTGTAIKTVGRDGDGFTLATSQGPFRARALVIASGGLSIPKIGASPFGYNVAKQFGLKLVATRAALVPLTFAEDLLQQTNPLSGLSVQARVRSADGRGDFTEGLLFTHRGLSGPSILQISSYWREGEGITVDLAPGVAMEETLRRARAEQPKQLLHNVLGHYLPKRLAALIASRSGYDREIANLGDAKLVEIAAMVNRWQVTPSGSEGYRTAEVTLGGVDTDGLSSKTMEARAVQGLYFVGEVVDVTGHLGGHNFQWAWASAVAAGQAV